MLASLRYWRRPLADADKPNDPGQKHDLKARLGLKGRAASAPAPAPLMSAGVQLPPPDPEPVKADPKRTDATIPPRNENDNTPMPAALPGVERVRVEYINISDGESHVASQKTQRWVLVGSIVVVGAIAFFLGRGMAGSAASGENVEARKTEIAEKKKFLDGSKAAYQRMSSLADDLDKVLQALVKAKDDKTDPLDPAIEKLIGDALTSLSKFAAEKVAIDPVQAIGKSSTNGELAGEIVAFCVKTREVLVRAQDTLAEATAMAPLWVPPTGPGLERRLMVEAFEVDFGGTKVPYGKGTWIASQPTPQPVQLKDAAGAVTGVEFREGVLLPGRKDPVEVKTTQIVVADLAPLFAERSRAFKRYSFERIGLAFEELRNELRALNLSKLQVAADAAYQQVGR